MRNGGGEQGGMCQPVGCDGDAKEREIPCREKGKGKKEKGGGRKGKDGETERERKLRKKRCLEKEGRKGENGMKG